MFSLFDVEQKKYFNPQSTKEISEDLPEGKVYTEIGNKTLKTKILKDNKGREFRISGKADLILELTETNSWAVIDNKTSKISERLDTYWSQLEAYAQCLENAEIGYPSLTPITHLGLSCFEPDLITDHTSEFIHQRFKRSWKPLKHDPEKFFKLVTDLLDILHSGICPPPECGPGRCDLYRSALDKIEYKQHDSQV